MLTTHTKWMPKSSDDWKHVLCAYNELINTAITHEDAEPSDRKPMHDAMCYVANILESKANRACDKMNEKTRGVPHAE